MVLTSALAISLVLSRAPGLTYPIKPSGPPPNRVPGLVRDVGLVTLGLLHRAEDDGWEEDTSYIYIRGRWKDRVLIPEPVSGLRTTGYRLRLYGTSSLKPEARYVLCVLVVIR